MERIKVVCAIRCKACSHSAANYAKGNPCAKWPDKHLFSGHPTKWVIHKLFHQVLKVILAYPQSVPLTNLLEKCRQWWPFENQQILFKTVYLFQEGLSNKFTTCPSMLPHLKALNCHYLDLAQEEKRGPAFVMSFRTYSKIFILLHK